MKKNLICMSVLLLLFACDSQDKELKKLQAEKEELKGKIMEKQAEALEKQKQALAAFADEKRQQLSSQWNRIQELYQKRNDAVQLLVRFLDFHQDELTEKGEESLAAVTYSLNLLEQATANGGIEPAAGNESFAEFQKMQDALALDLAKLVNEIEVIPTLKIMREYLDFRTALESTVNRIAVERMELDKQLRELQDLREAVTHDGSH